VSRFFTRRIDGAGAGVVLYSAGFSLLWRLLLQRKHFVEGVVRTGVSDSGVLTVALDFPSPSGYTGTILFFTVLSPSLKP